MNSTAAPVAPAILLVEDNADDEALTLRALAQHDLDERVAVARDGQQALARLLAPEAELPALVLLDLKLPKVDGLEVLRRLRTHARTRTLPVVILTSSQEATDVATGYAQGCNSYVRKPVDFREFVEVVRQLKAYWLALNTSPPAGNRGN
jgi:two-component system, response regulator